MIHIFAKTIYTFLSMLVVARDVRCGLLQCINADQLTDISEYKYVSNRRVIITEESNSFTCRYEMPLVIVCC